MSEDRLEKALEAMRNESVSDAELTRAHNSVLQKLIPPEETLCARFQVQFEDYLQLRLTDSRLMLIEDHLGRCTRCRARLAELRGEQIVVEMPSRPPSRVRRRASWAAAAAALCAAIYMGLGAVDTALLRGPRATVESVGGSLYLVSEGILNPGANIGENQTVHTGPDSRAVLRLNDGSLVEINERTELSINAARSGKSIRLHSGDIIVQAAKQRRQGGLRIATRDSVTSVNGTIFAVSSGLAGSRVSVIEGSVTVARGGVESLLMPGQQTASNPALLGPINETVAWSRNADEYFSILASLYKIEQELAAFPAEPMRTQSALFELLPPGTIVYGAIPNISGTLSRAADLIDRHSAENPAFGAWWDSASGRSLSLFLSRIYVVAHLLGDEVVFGLAGNSPEKIPFVIAEIQSGKQDELAFTLDVAVGDHINMLPIRLTDSLMTVSNSGKNLAWLNENLGYEEQSPFIDEIRARYEEGASWLLALNIEAIEAMESLRGADSTAAFRKNPDGKKDGFASVNQLKYLFLEQRSPLGAEENSLTVSFKGPRTGLASFLASSGSVGAAEYLSNDVIVAGFVSTREPAQMLDEMAELFAGINSVFAGNAAAVEFTEEIQLATEFASVFGTESAFGIEGISVSGPVWMFAAPVYDSAAFDETVSRLTAGANAPAAQNGSGEYLAYEETVSDGRAWRSLKSSEKPFAITWTYDRGHIVAASDRGAAQRALAAKNGGGALVWSSEFQRQIAVSAGINPSAFVWVNTRGMLSGLAGLLTSNQAISRLLTQKDPMLAVFTATPERIHAASRARISELLIDLMLMQGIGNFQ
ncbi:MAG: FecR family protein [Acidobacteria bacterium]|nr:FecR family protein [Acidobacteriota bacterium]